MSDDAVVTRARIRFDADGIPHASDYDDVYHSADGGPAQARHVFLGGNDLPARWRGRRRFALLETGFGLGLNFLCTARACLDDPQGPQRLDVVSVEKHPPGVDDLERAHAHWPGLAALSAELRAAWPPPLRGFHRIEFARGRIVLTLLFGEAAPMLAQLDGARFDAVYLDGFAPRANPQMWSPEVFGEIARLCRADATAATWSVAAHVRAGLQSAGFALERRPGFGRKRDMLCARRTGTAWVEAPRARHAIVIGAGVAGCWAAHALVRRGWTVDLIERHAAPALAASGNPVGALQPALNLADNANARLARAAFLHASRALGATDDLEVFARCGLLHLALEREPGTPAATGSRQRQARRERMQAILHRHRFPAEYVRWIERGDASDLAGMPVAGDGWWIPAGGRVHPQRLCTQLLAQCAPDLRAHFGVRARRLRHVARGWEVIDADGRIAATAPIAIVANAYAAAELGLAGLPRLIAVRGQITLLPPARDRAALRCVVCGDGYAAALPDGGLCVGATFEPGSTALDMRAHDHAENLRRAERMLPGATRDVAPALLDGRVGLRTATADRLPACGELGPQPGAPAGAGGLHLLAGLGARGLIWAPLCAEILAATLEDEPNPVEASLITAMRPDRDPVDA